MQSRMGLKDPFRVLILICTMKLNRLFLVSVPALCLAFSSCSSGSRKADDDIPLPASVDVPHVAEGDYADMSCPNLTFTADKIVCNYPVESHVYVIDRRSGQTDVFEAPSRYTANKAEPCRSRTDYTQWERHRVENPHFYELMYLPASGRYVRLHTAGQTYDASKKLMDQLLEKRFFLTSFDHDFSVLGEEELPAHRYNIFTGWCPASDAILFYVDHPLSGGKETEELVIDCIE